MPRFILAVVLTYVAEQDGFTTTRIKIGLGSVTNYESGLVYEVKYRGHYGVVGEEDSQDIAEGWQDSGLYFEAEAPLSSDASLSTVLGQSISATGSGTKASPKQATMGIRLSEHTSSR